MQYESLYLWRNNNVTISAKIFFNPIFFNFFESSSSNFPTLSAELTHEMGITRKLSALS